jgi:formylglycine-generating enzyme required for sulfatase activity
LDVITIDLPNLPPDARPLRLVRIPAGTFEMGNTGAYRDRFCPGLTIGCAAEFPQHTVTLTHDFYMGEVEITQGQWLSVTGPNPMKPLDLECGRNDNLPVARVSWDDCQPFIQNLTWMTGIEFRLPTEAEWEYACRGTSRNPFRYDIFSFGDNPYYDFFDGFQYDPYFDQYMVWAGNYHRENPNPNFECGPKEVASRWPNDHGLYDMHGNVAEWCQDWYQPDFYGRPEATQPDPVCADPSSGTRPARGGYFSGPAPHCRSAFRNRIPPTYALLQTGFRIVFIPE